MRKLTKGISLLLCAAFVFMLAACVNPTPAPETTQTTSAPAGTDATEPAPNPITGLKEKITITVLTQKEATELEPFENMEVFKIMEERTNIAVKFDQPAKTNFAERYSIVMASKELPDVITVMPIGDVPKYASAKTIIEMTDIIDKEMPNLSRYMAEFPDIKAGIRGLDGKIYSIPTKVYDYTEWNNPIIVRGDWLEKLKIDMPKNIDDVYNMWMAIKNGDPNGNKEKDEIPYTARDAKERIRSFLTAFGVKDGFYNDPATNKIKFGVLEPGYKQGIEWLRKCHDDGLIDPDLPSASEATLQAKVAQDIAGSWRGGMRGNFATYQSTFEDKIPGFKVVGVPTIESVNGKHLHHARPKNMEGTRTVITTASKYPTEIARWMDYAFSDEGNILFNFGIENETFVMKDGKPVFSDAIANDPEGRSPFIMQTTFSPISGVGFPCVYYSEAVNQLENQEVVAVRNAMDKYRQDTLDFVLPDLPFTNEDNAQIRSIMGEVNTYVDETLASFIFGGESFSKWDEFVANVKKMDVEKLIDVYQKAYDNYKK